MNITIQIVLTAIITILVVQTIKLTTDGIKGNFNLKGILSVYGGMPSSHTATVTSLTTLVGYYAGVDSIAFGISIIFSAIIIVDAMKFRGFVDENSKVLKMIVDNHPELANEGLNPVSTKLQHTPLQVLIGGIIGFAIGALSYYIF
ncbi:MAG: divergent PAP2 family protein [Candidatus Kerfeldbacteria bacterium]|jgi:uncharacterized protein